MRAGQYYTLSYTKAEKDFTSPANKCHLTLTTELGQYRRDLKICFMKQDHGSIQLHLYTKSEKKHIAWLRKRSNWKVKEIIQRVIYCSKLICYFYLLKKSDDISGLRTGMGLVAFRRPRLTLFLRNYVMSGNPKIKCCEKSRNVCFLLARHLKSQ